MGFAFDFKNFDGFIRGTCCQSPTVIVKNSIVLLRSLSLAFLYLEFAKMPGEFRGSGWTYNHIIMTGGCDDLRLRMSAWSIFKDWLDVKYHNNLFMGMTLSNLSLTIRGQNMRIRIEEELY